MYYAVSGAGVESLFANALVSYNVSTDNIIVTQVMPLASSGAIPELHRQYTNAMNNYCANCGITAGSLEVIGRALLRRHHTLPRADMFLLTCCLCRVIGVRDLIQLCNKWADQVASSPSMLILYQPNDFTIVTSANVTHAILTTVPPIISANASSTSNAFITGTALEYLIPVSCYFHQFHSEIVMLSWVLYVHGF